MIAWSSQLSKLIHYGSDVLYIKNSTPALSEFFSFLIFLSRDPIRKKQFLQLSNRQQRGEYMEHTGFNRYIIWNALDTIIIKTDTQEISVLKWIEQEESSQDFNHKILINSLKRSGFDPIELKIRQELLRYHNRIKALSGGAQGPMASRSGGANALFHHSPIQTRSTPEFELGPAELNDSHSHVMAEFGPELGAETSLHAHASEPGFAQTAASSTDIFTNSPAREQGFQSSIAESHQADSSHTGDQQAGHETTRADQGVGRDHQSNQLARETIKDNLADDLKSSLKEEIKTTISDKVNEYTSFEVTYTSSTYSLYDGKHFDLTITFSIDGTLNPQLERTPGDPKDASISLEGSDLDFNVTFGLSYSKESYMFADYDIKLEGTVSSDITLTLHKEPDQKGINNITLSATGLTFTIYAGLIESLDYSGPMVNITFDPSVEWSFNLSRADGLTVYKPEVELGLEINYKSPLLEYLEEGLAYLEDGIGYLEDAVGYVDEFMQEIYSDAAKDLQQAFGEVEQGIDQAVSELSGTVNSAISSVESTAESAWNNMVSGAESAWNSTTSSVDNWANDVGSWF